MRTAIVGILLGMSKFAAADIGGAVTPISTERCNGKLAVRGDQTGAEWQLRRVQVRRKQCKLRRGPRFLFGRFRKSFQNRMGRNGWAVQRYRPGL